MNSYTSARIYVGLPNALSLNQAALDAAYAGISGANVDWVRITLPWNAVQTGTPITTTTVTRVVTTTVTNSTSSTITAVTTVTTTVGSGTPTVTTSTTVRSGTARSRVPRTTTTTTSTTGVSSTPVFSWATADLAVNRALAAGLKIQLVLVGPLPTGVTTVTPATFTPFAQAAAQRYGPGGPGITVAGQFVAEFQVWDEPNVNTNWPAATSPAPVSASGYTAVLKAAYAAIKASHPGAVVLMAGLQACTTATTQVGRTLITTRQDPVAYLNAMYSAGVTGYFDVAAYHPLTLPTGQFPDPPAPSGATMKQADAFWTVLKAREPGKKVYWSKVGFVSGPTNGVGVISEDQQAAYLDTMRWFTEDRKLWVAGLGLVSWRD